MKQVETDLWSRRKFVQLSAAAAIAASTAGYAEDKAAKPRRSMIGAPFEKREPRIAFVGTGGRGTSLLRNVLAAAGHVVALCDIVRSKAEKAAELVVKAGQPKAMAAIRWGVAGAVVASVATALALNLLVASAQGKTREVVENAGEHLEPQLIATYLRELAAAFHAYYNSQQFLVDDPDLRDARLTLAAATRQVLANGLDLLGVFAPESM